MPSAEWMCLRWWVTNTAIYIYIYVHILSSFWWSFFILAVYSGQCSRCILALTTLIHTFIHSYILSLSPYLGHTFICICIQFALFQMSESLFVGGCECITSVCIYLCLSHALTSAHVHTCIHTSTSEDIYAYEKAVISVSAWRIHPIKVTKY